MADEYKRPYRGLLHNDPYPQEGVNWQGLLAGFGDIPRGLLSQFSDAIRNPHSQPVVSQDQLNRIDQGDAPGVAAELRAAAPGIYRTGLSALPVVGPIIGAATSIGDQATGETSFDRARSFANTVGTLAMAAAPGKKGGGGIKRSTELANLRGLPTDEAIAIARRQEHLIPSGDQSEGLHVGGPRSIQSAADLRRRRAAVDRGIDAGAAGGDWYDRYRNSVNEVTGGDPILNRWMGAQEGQWSAGVDPRSELGFATKENNASIAGMPVKSARPAQHEAHLAAIEAKDPGQYQLGEKTGEYAERITPRTPAVGHNGGPPLDDYYSYAGATGVNDFRWAAEHGFTEPDGTPQKNALTDAQHRYLDYETALAVDRANKRAAGGRTNWTGEQVQAAGWVRQKADSILEKRANEIQSDVDRATSQAKKMGLSKEDTAAAVAKVRSDHDARAFAEANRQIGDFYDANTSFGQHESRPGVGIGHLPSLLHPDDVAAYHADPASTWATAPGGRDAIYAGLGIPGTGVNMRVRPTTDMQGIYTPPGGATEFNPGQSARPLTATDIQQGHKYIAPADRQILQAGETLRAALDVQNAGSAIKPYLGQKAGSSLDMWIPMSRKLTPEETLKLRDVGAAHGLPDVADTGSGVAMTDFSRSLPAQPMPRQQQGLLTKGVGEVLPGTQAQRSLLDTVYAPLYEEWGQGVGSGAVTRKVLDEVGATPRLRTVFSENPYIPERAQAKMQRDAASPYGAPRPDVQNFREIVASGPGWPQRLQEALASGKVSLPAFALTGGGLLGLSGLGHPQEDQSSY